ncbi:MAG: TraR/DksA C4-type zinc finger protein [Desulfatibacillaceae bacterium]|nr:TraR/DksA C4-type zinc finger protein [Desulfatibacillaceae bacterium]
MRDDLDLEAFRQKLTKRKEQLEKARRPIETVTLDQSRIGRLTRMDAMQQQAMSRAAARLAQMEEGRISLALERLAEGDYGYCVQCEEQIPKKRLEADPSALTCIRCARSLEG